MYIKYALYEVVIPMLWLAIASFVFSLSAIKLSEAWKEKNKKKMWFNLWIILLGVYFFFFQGGHN